ncbi:MAG: branched-chain amino acid ABC transporter permease [Thermoplasmata archaeon]
MPGFFVFIIAFFVVAGIFAIATLALNLQWGSTGLFNIGIGAFMAVGAYTSAILTTAVSDPPPFLPGHLGGFSMPFIIGILGGMAAAGFLGLLIALPTLRLRADYLAIATIGLAEIIRLYILNALTITGGTFTIRGIPRPDGDISDLWAWLFGGQTLVIGPGLSTIIMFAVVITVIILVYLVFERSTRSPWGRVLKGIREDEDAAAALGKNTFRYKVQVFVIGSMVMGAAGALLVSWFRVAEANTTFVPADTFLIWIMLIIGGSGNNKGAILGAIIVWGLFSLTILFTASLPDFLRANFTFIRLASIGAVLILLMMFRPQGILGEEKVISKMG